jgi:hypothetical protein
MNKQLNDFIDFFSHSSRECCDLQFLSSADEWLEPLLGKNAKKYFRIYFRNRAGDLVGEWDSKGKFGNEKPLPFVWLSSEGTPQTVVAKDTAQFLSLLPYGQQVLTGIPVLVKAHLQDPEFVIDPGTEFTLEAVQKSFEYEASRFPGHADLVGFITNTLRIRLEKNPLETIIHAVDSFPDLEVWIEQHLA